MNFKCLTIKNEEYCIYCNKRFTNLESHEMEHFKDRLGGKALLECHKCFRTYLNMNDLKTHINNIHGVHKNNKLFHCDSCGQNFTTQNGRDQHLITHIPHIMELCMEGVDKRMENADEYLESNECPLCKMRTSTRKSFRFHLLFSHLLKNPKSLLTLVVNEEVVGTIPETELKVIGFLAKKYNHKKNEKEEKKKKREALKKLLISRKRYNSRTASTSSSGIGSSIGEDDTEIIEELKRQKQTKQEINENGTTYIKKNIDITLKKQVPIKSQNDNNNFPSDSSSLSSIDEPILLRERLISKCLKAKIKSNDTVFTVCICNKKFENQSDFEIHIACVHFVNGQLVI
ncbi:Zinc finger, C2H2 domain and Zinc finger, C2H2-like domain-containing protein [Strongyloides ratti]|uniref:Zinc finger, C2H2 domain and Zinc finger, C2H2-like domain-containing protein n=1 Tax=Strongyloides ratti TaxID=34506 RepID=A0A090LQ00_STRRB|nr:Zinc finger, C2H2 domain and Zinc finger, C2H2-like domain-containing protein [Strongyloides ratti]CEF70209.1 Zinc finger, C2H2 domain and Zinc finger, C2H2-like domain-containing protein [Strongyloides ratti]